MIVYIGFDKVWKIRDKECFGKFWKNVMDQWDASKQNLSLLIGKFAQYRIVDRTTPKN